MLMTLTECHGSHNAAARRYMELYPNRARHPSAAVILATAQRLHETGSCLPNKHDTGRNRVARNLRNTETIVRAFEQQPETSIHGLSYSTVQRTLREEKLHAYYYTRVQHLLPEDYLLRRVFCENFLRRAIEIPVFLLVWYLPTNRCSREKEYLMHIICIRGATKILELHESETSKYVGN